MINNKIDCMNFEEFTGRDGTSTLEVWKQKNNRLKENIRKIQSILVRPKPGKQL